MPFDKSRHLCLQAFPTSILINGGSLRHHHHHHHHTTPHHSARLAVTYSTLLSTASGVNHASSGTPTRTVESTQTLRVRKNEKTQVQVIRRAGSVSHMWSTKSFLRNIQSHCCSGGKPPVESAHRHCGAARCPRC